MRAVFTLCLLVLAVTGSHAAVIYINQSSDPANILAVDAQSAAITIAHPGSGTNAGRAIAVDAEGGAVIFSDTGGLYRSSNGSTVPIFIPSNITGLGRIVDIELDHLSNKVLYLDDSGNVLQSDLNGNGMHLLRRGGDIRSDGIAIDLALGRIYFNAITYDSASTLYRHAVRSMNLDGTSETLFANVATVNAFSSGGSSADLEVNAATSAVYLSDRFSASVYAFTALGALSQALYTGGINDFWGPMAFDATSSSLILTAPEVSGANGQLWSIGIQDRTIRSIVGKQVVGLAYGFYGVDVGPNPSPTSSSGSAPEPATLLLVATVVGGMSLSSRRQVHASKA